MKLRLRRAELAELVSLPTRERELKRGACRGAHSVVVSLPTRERELKHQHVVLAEGKVAVAPYTGA